MYYAPRGVRTVYVYDQSDDPIPRGRVGVFLPFLSLPFSFLFFSLFLFFLFVLFFVFVFFCFLFFAFVFFLFFLFLFFVYLSKMKKLPSRREHRWGPFFNTFINLKKERKKEKNIYFY